jgi:hypothetical protein
VKTRTSKDWTTMNMFEVVSVVMERLLPVSGKKEIN